MTKKELAISLHDRGFNCAQSVACAFAEEIGVPEEVLFAASEAFGRGMGGMDGTCGAVSGAIMLAGFKNSCADPAQPTTKAATYVLAEEITRAFAAQNGSLVCRELKGENTGKPLRSCPDCIMDAVEIVEKVLGL
ncbi:MAG: C_GCAxxG_C_C family protein [Lachnospiraceae bacterium]|nr:C_GCAxxG_C_C family protein [Lachnospiraceae bacterium]